MRATRRTGSRVASRLRRRGLHIALLTIGLAALQASQCPKDDFYDPLFGGLDPTTGDIFGRVTVDGEGRSGVTVTIRQGTTVVATDVTDGDGDYEVLELDPGTYTVSISEIAGVDCPEEQTVIVVEDDETERNFACTTPEPQTGIVTGTVTVNDVAEAGVTVTLLEGSTTIATTTTGSNGTYTFTNVEPGTKTVAVAAPEGATCPDPQNVDVPAGGTATANFPCTESTSGDFTVDLSELRWEHTMPGVESLECKIISTTPAQAGATWSATVTGPGVISGQTFGGTLNANGQAELRVRINSFGTYTNTVTVTSGGVSRNASANVTVAPAANTCAAVASSARFKTSVASLLPDDVRPLGLNPVAYRYLEPWGDPSIPRIGLIAEELATVYPEAVYLDAEGRPDAIDYPALTRRVTEAALARGARALEAALEGIAGDR